MQQMRTIEQAATLLKEQDENTSVTKNCIRNWIKNNQLKHVRVGNRYLVSLETLGEFLKGDIMPEQAQQAGQGNIRRINE